MSIIHTHPDGSPWYLTDAEVMITIAIGRARRRIHQRAQIPETPPDDADGTRKKCRHCKKWRPLERFYNHPTTADGLDGRCKDCKRDYDAQRRERLREAAGGR